MRQVSAVERSFGLRVELRSVCLCVFILFYFSCSLLCLPVPGFVVSVSFSSVVTSWGAEGAGIMVRYRGDHRLVQIVVMLGFLCPESYSHRICPSCVSWPLCTSNMEPHSMDSRFESQRRSVSCGARGSFDLVFAMERQ